MPSGTVIKTSNNPESLLDSFSAEEREFWKRQEPTPIFSHACIVTSFGGDFRDGGYAREKVTSKSAMERGYVRNFAAEGKRNALKQSPKIQNVEDRKSVV